MHLWPVCVASVVRRTKRRWPNSRKIWYASVPGAWPNVSLIVVNSVARSITQPSKPNGSASKMKSVVSVKKKSVKSANAFGYNKRPKLNAMRQSYRLSDRRMHANNKSAENKSKKKKMLHRRGEPPRNQPPMKNTNLQVGFQQIGLAIKIWNLNVFLNFSIQ